MHDDNETNETNENESNPLRAMFQRMLSGAQATTFDYKAEREAFDRAKTVAVRIAIAVLPARHYSLKAFVDGLNETFFVPLRANPLIKQSDVHKIALALQEKTGVHKESDVAGQQPHEETWSEALHSVWFEDVCEHVGWDLWANLPGPIDKKEDMLEEMLPIVEKFGNPLAITMANYRRDPQVDSDEKTPLQAAGTCAAQKVKELLIDKAKEMGLFKV